MSDAARQSLRSLAEREAGASVVALALAERAVAEGRLNIAKVMRARALACQRRAQLLASAAVSVDEPWERVLATLHEGVRGEREALSVLDAEPSAFGAVLDGLAAEEKILHRAAAALAKTRDVGEDVVPQFLWGCETCGFIAEASRPELCPACGNIGGEFAMFAPFFSATREHLGRRAPGEALALLDGDGARLAVATADVADVALRAKPAPGEWCMKEIAGHMIDICEIALRAVGPALDPSKEQKPERTPLPWKLLDYEGYPDQPIEAILSRFEASTGELLQILRGLPPGAWRTSATLISGRTPLVDVLSWVVNHNAAHLEQIRALRTTLAC